MITGLWASGVMIAALSAGLMGYAIQRGATCTVAAVGEIVSSGKTNRVRALAETAVWVGGGLLLMRALGGLPMLPDGFPLSGWVILGGALLGLGAFINGACLFGAIARFGSGDWMQGLAPLGFYLGLISFTPLFGRAVAHSLPTGILPPMSTAAQVFTALFCSYVLWRGWRIFGPNDGSARLHRVWRPHEATLLIGVAFVILLVTAGFWTYTDLLFDLSRGRMRNILVRLLLFVALFVGAVLGGLTAGRFVPRRVAAVPAARALAGGTLMGWGGALTPGGNDWLILVGLPLLWPYAWLAVIMMSSTIFVAFKVERRLFAAP